MPRQSRGRSAPRSAAPPQSRGAHTAAAPSNYASHPPAPSVPAGSAAQPKQPGMIAQMAATAGSVAVGSTIGHGISSMLFGGTSTTPESQAPPQPASQASQFAGSCDVQAKDFTKCVETANFDSCSWYLEQLKACQAAAAPY